MENLKRNNYGEQKNFYMNLHLSDSLGSRIYSSLMQLVKMGATTS